MDFKYSLRIVLINAFVWFFSHSGFAQVDKYEQSSTFGLRFSALYSTSTINDAAHDLIDAENELGISIGAFFRLKINNLYFQTGVDFSVINNGFVLHNYAGSPNYPATGLDEPLNITFHQIELPMMLGYKWNSFRIDAGPVLNVLLNTKGEFMGEELNVTADYRRFSFAIRGGVGVDFGNLGLDFKYEKSLSRLGESLYVLVGEEQIVKFSHFHLSASYFFKSL